MKEENKRKEVFWIKKKFTRRKFIQSAVGGVSVTLGLPIFDYLLNNNGTAFADGEAFPMRFGTFFWGLGYGLDINHWIPNGSGLGANWQIPANHGLSGLNEHKDYLTIFSNYSHPTPSGAGHIPQRGVSVSASHNPNWVLFSGANGFRLQNMPHASVDALVQQYWGGSLNTPYPFLNVGLGIGTQYRSTSSWNAGGGSRLFYQSPVDFYNAVFGPIQGSPTNPPSGGNLASVTDQYKLSVLDLVKGPLETFALDLGAEDRLRLQQHADSIRALEIQMQSLAEPPAEGCDDVDAPSNYNSASEISLRNNVMAELMALALKCNLTRVFCYEHTPTQCNGTIPEIGLSATAGVHDGYSHGNTQGMRDYLSFVMSNLGVFLGKLKSTPEGDGNLLDHMLICGTGEYAGPHHHNGHPYLFAGKGCGLVKGNYHSLLPNTSNNSASRILLTAAHGVGANLASLGMPSTPVGGAAGGPANTANYQTSTVITDVLT